MITPQLCLELICWWALNSNLHLQAFYNNVSVKQVDVFSTVGAFGILPNHVPSIAVLKPGQLTVHEQDKTAKYFGKRLVLKA